VSIHTKCTKRRLNDSTAHGCSRPRSGRPPGARRSRGAGPARCCACPRRTRHIGPLSAPPHPYNSAIQYRLTVLWGTRRVPNHPRRGPDIRPMSTGLYPCPSAAPAVSARHARPHYRRLACWGRKSGGRRWAAGGGSRRRGGGKAAPRRRGHGGRSGCRCPGGRYWSSTGSGGGGGLRARSARKSQAVRSYVERSYRGGLKQSTVCMARRKTMITMDSPYFVWINANEIISSWYLLGAVCVAPPVIVRAGRAGEHRHARGRADRRDAVAVVEHDAAARGPPLSRRTPPDPRIAWRMSRAEAHVPPYEIF
jgi:hypothetical protein